MEEGQSRGTLSLRFSESQVGDPYILRALEIQYEMYQKNNCFCCHVQIVMWLLYCLLLTTYIITKHVCIGIWAKPERLIYKVFCFPAATAHVSSVWFSGGIINHNHHKFAGMNSRRFNLMQLYILCLFSSLLNSFIFIAAML